MEKIANVILEKEFSNKLIGIGLVSWLFNAKKTSLKKMLNDAMQSMAARFWYF